MRRQFGSCVLLMALLSSAVSAQTPRDFLGTWQVSRMVGAADVHSGTDNPKMPLGTAVAWTESKVTNIDGTCQIVRPSVTPVSIDTLQHSIWGGQPITGLDLPKTTLAKVFHRTAIPVFDDGGKQCSQAVMLSANQLLLMFENGYLYVLDRDARKPQ